jgi:hypothetical protein
MKLKMFLGFLALLQYASAQEQNALRLAGTGALEDRGRLEVFHDGMWGTVCDDYFTAVDASVACFQLGFGYNGVALVNNPYGTGMGPIWLDDVECVGTETQLGDCPHLAWGTHNCAHSEDVAIRCYGPTTPVPVTTISPGSVTPPYREFVLDGDVSAQGAPLTPTCINDYTAQFRETLNVELEKVRGELAAQNLCPGNVDFVLAAAYVNMYGSDTSASVSFGVDFATRGQESLSGTESCSAAVSSYLSNFANWAQPIWSDIPGCSHLAFTSTQFAESSNTWWCPA